jgi:hypothetical protein
MSELSSEEIAKPSLSELIKNQVEFYFGPENLSRDKWLVDQIDSSSTIGLSILLNFPKMKALTQDAAVVKAALVGSTVVSISDDKIKVNNYVKAPAPSKRGILILREVPSDVEEAEIRDIFNFPGCKPIVSISKDIENMWSVYMENEEDAKEAYMTIKFDRKLRGEAVKVRVKQESVLKATSVPFIPGGGGMPGVALGSISGPGFNPAMAGMRPLPYMGASNPYLPQPNGMGPPNLNNIAINSPFNPFHGPGHVGMNNNSNSNSNNNNNNSIPSDSWKRSNLPPKSGDFNNDNSVNSGNNNSNSNINNNASNNNVNNNNNNQQKEKKAGPNKGDNSNSNNSGRSKNNKKEEPVANPVKIDSVSFPPLPSEASTPGFKGPYTRWTHDEIIAIVRTVDVNNAHIPPELQAHNHPLAMSVAPNLDLLHRQRSYSIDEVREQLNHGRPVSRMVVAEGSSPVDVNQLAGDDMHKNANAPSSKVNKDEASPSGSKAGAGSWAKLVSSVSLSTESSGAQPTSAAASSASDESSKSKGAAKADAAKASAVGTGDKKGKAGNAPAASLPSAAPPASKEKDAKGDKKSGGGNSSGGGFKGDREKRETKSGSEKGSDASSTPPASSPNSSSAGEESPSGPWKTSFASVLKK